jgi:hypothetical protein
MPEYEVASGKSIITRRGIVSEDTANLVIAPSDLRDDLDGNPAALKEVEERLARLAELGVLIERGKSKPKSKPKAKAEKPAKAETKADAAQDGSGSVAGGASKAK